VREDEAKSRKLAKKFRRAPTHAEALVWLTIRRICPHHHFRRQHPIGPHIADFACARARLVIEVDGPTHSSPEAIAYDCRRSAYLREKNWRVVRLTNDEVYADVEGALRRMARLLPTPAPPRIIVSLTR
jgi:very-short-patch-repair endonuclease